MSVLAERAVDVGFGAGWRLVRRLPAGVAGAGFQWVGDVAARRNGPSIRQLRTNLGRVLGSAGPVEPAELEAAVRTGARSYARYWCEAFRLPTMDHVAVHDVYDRGVIGAEYLEAAVAAGRGTVIALTHSGNWDATAVWLVEWLRRRGERPVVTTVAERLRPESLYRRFVGYRESLGLEVLPMTGGDVSPFTVLSRRLRDNGVIALLCDRDLSGRGVETSFFGETARMPAGPALLGARTGAAVLPLTSWHTSDSWGTNIQAPIPVPEVRAARAATQLLADAHAADIACHPTDWHMMQPIWSADLAARADRGPAR